MSKPNSIAIALEMSKRRKKKMAKGGEVKSAASEQRPMPEERDNDSAMISRNDSKKSLIDSKWDSQPERKQSMQGMRTTPIKHPKMAPSTGFSSKLRDREDELLQAARPNNGPQEQPPDLYDEEEADKKGPSVPALKMKMMAEGGEVRSSQAKKEGDCTVIRPDTGWGAVIQCAEGGEISPEDEIDEENHASLVAAIMAKRRKMAEGGAVGPDSDMADIEHENNVEHPNSYYRRNEDSALKENYDEDMLDVSQPMDSNEKSVDIDSDDHDMVSLIRRKMKSKAM